MIFQYHLQNMFLQKLPFKVEVLTSGRGEFARWHGTQPARGRWKIACLFLGDRWMEVVRLNFTCSFVLSSREKGQALLSRVSRFVQVSIRRFRCHQQRYLESSILLYWDRLKAGHSEDHSKVHQICLPSCDLWFEDDVAFQRISLCFTAPVTCRDVSWHL